jgi:hypothetical protein
MRSGQEKKELGKKIRLWLVGTRADTHSFEGLYQNNPDR